MGIFDERPAAKTMEEALAIAAAGTRDEQIKRLRAALADTVRLLTFEQMQDLSENTAHVLIGMGLLLPRSTNPAADPNA